MEELKDTLGLVNDWLKFAEAKNAILVAASGTALWAVARLLMVNDLPCLLFVYMIQLLVFIFMAFITALLSFFPILNSSFDNKKQIANTSNNLLFFGYLATLEKDNLLAQFKDATGSLDEEIKKIDVG